MTELQKYESYVRREKLDIVQLEEIAYWVVKGADQSGSYLTSNVPILAYYHGKLKDVITYAIYLKGFTYWTDTDFGKIEKIEIKRV